MPTVEPVQNLLWGRAYTARAAVADVANQAIRDLERDAKLPTFALTSLVSAMADPTLPPPLSGVFATPPTPGPAFGVIGWHCASTEAAALARQSVLWKRFADHAGGLARRSALDVWTSTIRGRFVDLPAHDSELSEADIAAVLSREIDGVTYVMEGVESRIALVLQPTCILNVSLLRRVPGEAIGAQPAAEDEWANLFKE